MYLATIVCQKATNEYRQFPDFDATSPLFDRTSRRADWSNKNDGYDTKTMLAREGEVRLRGVHPVPSRQGEKKLLKVQPLPSRQAETQLRGVQPLPSRQAERRLHGVQERLF